MIIMQNYLAHIDIEEYNNPARVNQDQSESARVSQIQPPPPPLPLKTYPHPSRFFFGLSPLFFLQPPPLFIFLSPCPNNFFWTLPNFILDRKKKLTPIPTFFWLPKFFFRLSTKGKKYKKWILHKTFVLDPLQKKCGHQKNINKINLIQPPFFGPAPPKKNYINKSVHPLTKNTYTYI